MAHKLANVVPEHIHLQYVNLLQCRIEAGQTYFDEPVEPHGFNLDIGKEIAYDIDQESVRIRLFFKVKVFDEKQNNLDLEAEIGIEFQFIVENFTDYLEEGDDENLMELGLAATLINISYATSRGIILEKTQNTFFKGIILPVIDSTKLLLEDEGKSQS